MKKILVGIHLLVIGLCLVGCENLCSDHIDSNNDYVCDKCSVVLCKNTPITDKYFNVDVTGSTDSLMEEIKTSYKAGTKVLIKAYPVTDITLYVFVNDEKIGMSHFDSDYWGYEFIMPEEDVTIHLTYDRFYGKDDYTFSDLYYWTNLLKNVDKVAIYNKNYTYEEFSEIYYISNSSDISRMVDIVNQPLEKYDALVESDQVHNDTITAMEFYTTIIYYGDELEYSLDFVNNMLYWYDFSTSQTFKFKDTNYLVPNATLDYDLKAYKFEYDGLSSDIKKMNDDSFVERYYQISSIEFVPYNGVLYDVEPTYYIDSRYGRILLHSATIFELNNEYYEIISGVDNWAYKYCQLEK